MLRYQYLNHSSETVGLMESSKKHLCMRSLRRQTTCKCIGHMKHGAASLATVVIKGQLYGVVVIRQWGYAKVLFSVMMNHATLLSTLKPGKQAFRSSSHNFVLAVLLLDIFSAASLWFSINLPMEFISKILELMPMFVQLTHFIWQGTKGLNSQLWLWITPSPVACN